MCTDGFRIHSVKYHHTNVSKSNINIAPIASKVIAGLPDGNYPIFLKGDRTMIAIDTDDKGGVLYSMTIEGNFPDVFAILPKDDDIKHRLMVNREDMLNNIAMLEPIAKTRVFPTMYLQCQKGSAKLGVHDTDTAAVLYAEYESDDPEFKIAFNPYFMVDMLKVAQDDCVTIEFVAYNNPMKIQEDNLTMVLMPMHLGD